MKYLVISDTHGYLKNVEEIIEKYRDEIDGIIHLGDLVKDAINIKYKYKDIPIEFVCGNNDDDVTVSYEKVLSVNGRKILITHGHRQRVYIGYMNLCYLAMEKGADVALHGHTHAYICQNVDGITICNPGSISFPRSTDYPTFGFMEVTEDGIIKISVMKYENGEAEILASI